VDQVGHPTVNAVSTLVTAAIRATLVTSKLSPMDLKPYSRWYDYSRARDEMFSATDTSWAPWYVVRSDDKKRARLNTITHLLHHIPYEDTPLEKVKLPDRRNHTGTRNQTTRTSSCRSSLGRPIKPAMWIRLRAIMRHGTTYLEPLLGRQRVHVPTPGPERGPSIRLHGCGLASRQRAFQAKGSDSSPLNQQPHSWSDVTTWRVGQVDRDRSKKQKPAPYGIGILALGGIRSFQSTQSTAWLWR
jgi:hypothetical protein